MCANVFKVKNVGNRIRGINNTRESPTFYLLTKDEVWIRVYE